MKKYLVFLLISFLIIGLFVLTGCDSNSAEDIKTGKNYEQGLNLSISSKEHNKNFRLHYDLFNDDFISDFSDDYPCYGKLGNDVLYYEIEFDMKSKRIRINIMILILKKLINMIVILIKKTIKL